MLEAAIISGQSLTDFVITSSLENARKIMEQNRVLELSARDCKKFVSALMEDAEPSEKLKQVVKDNAQFLE